MKHQNHICVMHKYISEEHDYSTHCAAVGLAHPTTSTQPPVTVHQIPLPFQHQWRTVRRKKNKKTSTKHDSLPIRISNCLHPAAPEKNTPRRIAFASFGHILAAAAGLISFTHRQRSVAQVQRPSHTASEHSVRSVGRQRDLPRTVPPSSSPHHSAAPPCADTRADRTHSTLHGHGVASACARAQKRARSPPGHTHNHRCCSRRRRRSRLRSMTECERVCSNEASTGHKKSIQPWIKKKTPHR